MKAANLISRMSVVGVRRAKAAFFSGCKSHPATIAPAGSNRSSHGGNEVAEASGVKGHQLVSLDFRSGSCVTSAARVAAARNCTRDEGGPFGFGDQELIPSYRKLLWSKAMVVSVVEKSGR